ncbi:hypothetical protein RQM47_04495 [Rubrivirga sp. S365]|uniref:Alpha/beta hydrolase family protein n=1 Tax=Rubrivirga litoralis TaxID=3075598 RepID=A0ABU3BMC9_9BACT|nr:MULTISPECIES: hypothetical protein [unclassified Rubrivirga]MDT0630381.1 hypothetical protein [Rubrivirga sp. F394]MDT7855892.1 hypothetical protein [Rubrivirga sp. S365]
MLARSTPPPTPLQVLDARPATVGGLAATRYRLYREHALTGDADVDRAFSTFDALVVAPPGRDDAPAVTVLNGITKGMDRSAPAAVALVRAGLGAVLFDTPLGGARQLVSSGHAGADLAELGRRGIALDLPFTERLFDGVAADVPAVLGLADREHGLGRGGRQALFGVSFGCLLSATAFARDGVGARFFGAIGHPDLPAMARGLLDGFARFSGLPAAVVAGGLRLGPVAEAAARRMGGEPAVGALRLARLLQTLGRGGKAAAAVDPLAWAGRVTADRPAFFLAGEADPVAPPADVRASAAAFARAEVEVLPALGHGWYPGARPAGALSFERACGAWLVRHLADWAE